MRTSKLNFDREFALKLWGISSSEIPEVLIIQGQRERESSLKFVETEVMKYARRLSMGDVVHGKYNDSYMLFASGFGGSLLADITHIAALIGVKYILIIGTAGGINPSLKIQDIIVPQIAIREDGVSDWYLPKGQTVMSDPLVNSSIRSVLGQNGLFFVEGNIISIPSMLNETREIINSWSNLNISGVDLETSAVFAVAEKFNIKRGGMLFIIDNLVKDHDISKITESDKLNNVDFMKKLVKCSFDIGLKAIHTF